MALRVVVNGGAAVFSNLGLYRDLSDIFWHLIKQSINLPQSRSTAHQHLHASKQPRPLRAQQHQWAMGKGPECPSERSPTEGMERRHSCRCPEQPTTMSSEEKKGKKEDWVCTPSAMIYHVTPQFHELINGRRTTSAASAAWMIKAMAPRCKLSNFCSARCRPSSAPPYWKSGNQWHPMTLTWKRPTLHGFLGCILLFTFVYIPKWDDHLRKSQRIDTVIDLHPWSSNEGASVQGIPKCPIRWRSWRWYPKARLSPRRSLPIYLSSLNPHFGWINHTCCWWKSPHVLLKPCLFTKIRSCSCQNYST